MRFTEILLVIFAALAALNLGIGFLLAIERILKSFGRKSKVWMCVYIIVTSLGIVALKIILERG